MMATWAAVMALPNCHQRQSYASYHSSTRSMNWETARLPEWCDEGAPVHWVQDADEPLSWAGAHRRLTQEGRRSRVNHPSEAQRRFEIREPATVNAHGRWRTSRVVASAVSPGSPRLVAAD
jgi:hypothetical protein